MAEFTIAAALRSTNTLFAPVGGVTVPANAAGATVALNMPVDAERASTSLHVDFGVEILLSPSTVWKPYMLIGWNGGGGVYKNSTVANTPPVATISGDFFQSFGGRQARLRVRANEPISIGATITVL
jgi:hypothetical protein